MNQTTFANVVLALPWRGTTVAHQVPALPQPRAQLVQDLPWTETDEAHGVDDLARIQHDLVRKIVDLVGR
jgi:hypothetical protein